MLLNKNYDHEAEPFKKWFETTGHLLKNNCNYSSYTMIVRDICYITPWYDDILWQGMGFAIASLPIV